MTRERWTGRTAFVLATIGSAVGLGNVWRFPYVAATNGGGAFLIPYFVALFTAGIPLLILETGLGQKLQGSAAASYAQVRRNMEWLGWFSLAIGLIISSYYAVVLAWCWNYMIHSFSLAWVQLGAEAFFADRVLKVSEGPAEIGGLVIPVLAGLLGSWAVAAAVISKGVGRLGRFNKVLLPIAFVLLIILLVRGLTLKNASEGLSYFLTPQFSALRDPKVWLAAYSQIFFTLSLGFGILIAYASYKPEGADVTNNAFITGLSNSSVEFIAGLTVFSTVGYLALLSGSSLGDLTVGGPGLTFQTYPTAIALIPHFGSFYGVVLFSMLLFLGFTSLVSLVEAMVTGLRDKFSISRRKATFLTCGVGAALGLIYTTRGGLHWLSIVDHWALTYGLAVIGIAECVLLGWFFKTGTLREFINNVSEIHLGYWWEICIKFITPGALAVTLVLSLFSEVIEPFEGYPVWALVGGGWVLLIVALLVSILFMRFRNKGVAVSMSAVAILVGYVELAVLSGVASAAITPEGWIMLFVGATVLFGGLVLAISTAIKKERQKQREKKIEEAVPTF
ncbi:MAG: sodium-dependent transporter [Candidatus Eiseniibacteriota bacterium]|nr:MAG: sodium-dependent transporter [Candidatus Eisenbacteria bacterium]